MSVVINDIPRYRVRKLNVQGEEKLYAVSVSVSRKMSTSGYATFVCDKDHIRFENNKYVLDFDDNRERTFKIKNGHDQYTTAQLNMKDVAESHIAAIEERRLEKLEAHRKELIAIQHDTSYFAAYQHKDNEDKIIHSYKTVGEAKTEVKNQVFNMLNADLNFNLLHHGGMQTDMNVSCDNDGYLTVTKTSYKKDAFAARKNTPTYKVDEVKETRFYVRNDKRMRISTWDWSDVLEDLKAKQEMNDKIFHEERSDEEWQRVESAARDNIKTGTYRVSNLSGQTTSNRSKVVDDVFGSFAKDIAYLKVSTPGE